MWDHLNKHVHASAKRMKIDDGIDPSSYFIDSYNETLARDTLKAVDKVFDVIYLIVFNRFPGICDLLMHDKFLDKWKIHSPDTIKYICKNYLPRASNMVREYLPFEPAEAEAGRRPHRKTLS